MTKTQFDNKLEILAIYDQRFGKLDREVLKLRELLHASRDNQAVEINEERQRLTKLEQTMHGHIDKLTQKT